MRRFRLSARRACLALITAGSCALLAVGVAAPAQAQQYGTIGNYHSGKCLDDPGWSTSNVQFDIWSCNYGGNQEFTVYATKTIPWGGGSITLYMYKVSSSGKCLDLWGGSSAWGTPIKQYGCNTSDDAQWWYLWPTDIPGWFLFASQATGFNNCMTVTNDSQSNGALVESWPCTSNVGGDHAMYWEPHSF